MQAVTIYQIFSICSCQASSEMVFNFAKREQKAELAHLPFYTMDFYLNRM